MHDPGLIVTLAGGLSAALILGYLTQRLGLSPIVGYLLAGILVSPTRPVTSRTRRWRNSSPRSASSC